MAGALGLASSIIAVADLTGKTIALTIKLKTLWKEVKDVPITLLDKAEYLQHLEELLDLAEQDATEDYTPTAVRNAINRARAAKNDVQSTIDAYTEELANRRHYRRRIAAAKFVIQKDDLRTVEQKLDRALELYKLANNVVYGRYNRLIYKKLAESTSTVAISTHNQSLIIDPGDSQGYIPSQIVTVKAAKPRTKAIFEGPSALGRLCFGYHDETYSFSLRVPDWLGGKVYSAMVQRSIAGWQSFLSVYPTIDRFEDEVFDILQEDDISALQKYLCENNLTPRVHNTYGFNLLHFSLEEESVETAKWLLSYGLYPGSFDECKAGFAASKAEYDQDLNVLEDKGFGETSGLDEVSEQQDANLYGRHVPEPKNNEMFPELEAWSITTGNTNGLKMTREEFHEVLQFWEVIREKLSSKRLLRKPGVFHRWPGNLSRSS
ncbi:hypothetical protein CGCF415_v009342 [Colletotrichum fructicola]|nr:hypothetical protein CGCFRS4_v007741 [Colletotrichum fructicola]KAF4902373.1 hypothetical protein CGCF415_v009342 [Colletotrichum fructicola]KAF4933784.1 hypothetical protein CGCF245_v009262 [Colletotrichum fructicola]